MSVPKPKVQLGNHCSTLFNNTLYAFSSTAFQSISLSSGAKWETLLGGVSTVGAECVHAHHNTPHEALYIVGGTTSDATATPTNGFMGLQRYLFNDKKWETIRLLAPVTFNLTNHGATFLETRQQIIVFSGTTWPDTATPSATTYLINTTAPYEIISIPAVNPLLAPLVLPWGDSEALIMGGGESNRGLRIFNPETGWSALTMSLEKGLPVRGKAGVSLMDGDDGSRMLYAFDLTSGPTTVTQLLVKGPGAASRVRRRQATAKSSATALTASTWPTYNSTLAPTSSMDGISIAYDGGTVVISPADDTNPMAVFDARTNSWVNAPELFSTASMSTLSVKPSISSTVPSASTSSAISSQSSDTAAAGTGRYSGLTAAEVALLVIGTIVAVLSLIAFTLIFTKHRRRPKNCQSDHGKRRMSFQDRGDTFVPEINHTQPRFPRAAIDSWASKDAEKHVFPVASAFSLDKNGTIISVIGGKVFSENRNTTTPRDHNTPARSSGWSRYFSGADTTNLAMPPKTYAHSPHSSTYTDLSATFPTLKSHTREGQIHPNPYLHSVGVGVATGGIATASSGIMAYGGRSSNLQRSGSKGLMLQDPGVGVHSPSGQLPSSNASISSLDDVSLYSIGIAEGLTDDNKRLSGWRPVDGRVASSVYPDSPGLQIPGLTLNKRGTDMGDPYVGLGKNVDDLGWFSIR